MPHILAMAVLAATPALAHDANFTKAPPAAPYEQVSKLAKLPAFIPGIGELFVDPKNIPAGPWLAYDHKGRLVSTIYMLPISAFKPDKKFDDLAAPGGKVDHVDVYYNPGHPGVEEPHIHVVLWHVPPSDEALVAK